VADATVLLAWRDAHPGVAFTPRPAAARLEPPQPRSRGDEEDAAVASAAPPPAPPPVCKFFTNTGRCALGDRCSRTHDAGADSQARFSLRRARALLRSSVGRQAAPKKRVV
jgi:hypothetical protein